MSANSRSGPTRRSISMPATVQGSARGRLLAERTQLRWQLAAAAALGAAMLP